MEVSLAPLYYGLLVILSIFLYNSVEDGTLLESTQKLFETINEKSEIVKENVIEYLSLDEDKNLLDSNIEIINNDFKENFILKYIFSIIEILKSFKSNINNFIKNTLLYNQLIKFLNFIKFKIYVYFDNHPQLGEKLSQIWVNLNIFYETAYDIISFRIITINNTSKEFLIKIYNSSKNSLFTYLNSIKTRFVYVIEKEPLKTYINKYIEFHNENIKPSLNYIQSYISLKLEESETDTETIYTYLLVITLTIFMSFILGKFFKFFAKEAYNVKEASEYAKRNQNFIANHDSSVYDEFKVKPWDDDNNDDDDNDEDLSSNASNRRQEGNINASNRRTSQQNSEINIKQEEEQEEQEQEIIEILDDEEINKEINKEIIDDVIDEMIEESSFEVEDEDRDYDNSTDVEKNMKRGIVHSNTNRRLMYLATGSVILDDSDNSNHNYDLSSNAISGVTLAVDDDVQKVPIVSSTSKIDESEARSSVRSLLI